MNWERLNAKIAAKESRLRDRQTAEAVRGIIKYDELKG